MPIPSEDGKFIHCSYCNQRFMFRYDADKHEKQSHADQLSAKEL